MVDTTVTQLQEKVRSLEDACDLLQTVLNGLSQAVKEQVEPDEGQIWADLWRVMTECGKTMDKLGSAIKKLRGGKQNIFKQSWTQVRLNVKKDDILAIRQRVASHMASVQLMVVTRYL